MSILISKVGILTTVQDLGRRGCRSLGINPNGAMDRSAARIINVLLGNRDSEVVLELHFPAGEIVFEKDAVFALGGADFGAILSNRPVESWQVHFAKAGDILRFTSKKFGQRLYFAIAGGLEVEPWLGSASTNLAAAAGGVGGRALRQGDRIAFNRSDKPPREPLPKLSPYFASGNGSDRVVRIIQGPEYESLTALSLETLFTSSFKITTAANRMGYRLAGPNLYRLGETEMLSSAVTFGTIQLLPDGQLIILMADHQTSGGYPRIGNVAARDLTLLAQLGPGEDIRFEPVSLELAEKSNLEFEQNLKFLSLGVRFAAM